MSLFKDSSTQNKSDSVFKIIALIAASTILILMAGIFIELISSSMPAIKRFGFGFLFSTDWDPVHQVFGAASSVFGTLISTFIAMLIAVPTSILIAIFLVELAPPVISNFFGAAIQLLAAIPSIIFGMWGLFIFAPFMSGYIQPALANVGGFLPFFQGAQMGIGILTAGIILAIMVLPFISAVVKDVFKMVPSVLKESAYGIGSTLWEVTYNVTIRYGIRGIIGAIFLGLGRAIGETMAVTFIIGNKHAISASVFSPATSIASTLANEFAEASEEIYLSALIELGLILFIISILIQIISQLWLARIRKTMGKGL
ncbi:MAG: phosphate ABC transporter permease subunit PstC [Calditrichales bacterium]|nr:MAG: phosphate ABC transporter permease subunit PstC [Calditrichales bacterium]